MKRRRFSETFAGVLGAGMLTLPGCGRKAASLPDPLPVPSFAEGRDALRALIAGDVSDTTLNPLARPRLYEHGRKTKDVVILFHGFTNCPEQFDELARRFYERGCNVFVPRIPRHGLKDRLTRTLADLTEAELQECTQGAFHFARGLGERVSALGLSLGGSMALWLAQAQPIDLAVAVSPFLMPIGIPRGIGTMGMRTLYTIPSMYWWWDPRVGENSKPIYAYPGFPTHALAEVTFFGDLLFSYAPTAKPLARSCVLVMNENESAVNNGVSRNLFDLWNRNGAGYREVVLSGLGAPRHDIIDPTTFPEARTLVYPKLEELVLGS